MQNVYVLPGDLHGLLNLPSTEGSLNHFAGFKGTQRRVRFGPGASFVLPALRSGARTGTMMSVARIEKIEKQARNSPENVSYSDMLKLCTHYFGEPRSGAGSHNAIFKMPWVGDPRINLQNKNGKAKPYQVKQAIAAIDRSKEK